MTRGGLAMLTLLSAALGTGLALELSAQPDESTVAAVPRIPAIAKRGGGIGATPDQTAQEIKTILARPLFEPTRRPPEEKPTVPLAETVPAPPRVSAIAISSNARSVIFAGGATDKPIIATEGMRVGAYTVKSIVPGEVTVDGPGGTFKLAPTFDPKGRAAGVAARPQPILQPPALPVGRFGLPNLPGLPAQPVPPNTQNGEAPQTGLPPNYGQGSSLFPFPQAAKEAAR